MNTSILHSSRIASNYSASCSHQAERSLHSKAPLHYPSRGRNSSHISSRMSLQQDMDETMVSASHAEGKRDNRQAAEGSSQAKQSPLVQSPASQNAWDRLELHKRVSDLKGRPFTAAFLAAATGREVSELAQQNPLQGHIAYQGAPGGFSEELAGRISPGLEPLPCEKYEDAFLALTGFAADRALVPIENSLGGSIHEILDLMLRYKVTIEREAFLTVRQCLVALPGTTREDIEKVISDPTSLDQCDHYLQSLPGIRKEAAADTAQAARAVAKLGERNVAAIASEVAARMYGLEVLDRNIQDNKEGDITRFVVLTRDSVKWIPASDQPHKVSVVFSFPEEPGKLFNALSAFALRDINLTKIESRPFKDDPIQMSREKGRRFQYRFYIDFIGHLGSTPVQNAIVHLQEIAPFVKILGCYPVDEAHDSAPSPVIQTAATDGISKQVDAAQNGSHPSAPVDSERLLISAAANTLPIQQDSLPRQGLRAAYQGNPGAYSEGAVLAAFPDGHPVPCEQFEDAFQALSQYLTDRAVLPIENSLGGSIHAVYDLLIQYNLYIVGEVTVKVNHCLLALPGVKKSELKRVISHYQALAQVDGYTRRLPGVVREVVDDTAGAAQSVARNGWRDTAAVASARAGQLYGLNALDTNIQDNKNNLTRFIILSRDPRVQSPSDTRLCKTSVVFSLKEGPGELFKACSVFALRGLDMSKIESRPMRSSTAGNGSSPARGFRYLFYVDFVASLANSKGQNALRHLTELATFIRVLGCYPMDMQEQ